MNPTTQKTTFSFDPAGKTAVALQICETLNNMPVAFMSCGCVCSYFSSVTSSPQQTQTEPDHLVQGTRTSHSSLSMSCSSWLIWDPQWLSGSTLTPDPRNRTRNPWTLMVLGPDGWLGLPHLTHNTPRQCPYLWWASQSRGQLGKDTCSSGCACWGAWPPSERADPRASWAPSCPCSPGRGRPQWHSPVTTEGTEVGWRSPSGGSASQTDPAPKNSGIPEGGTEI